MLSGWRADVVKKELWNNKEGKISKDAEIEGEAIWQMEWEACI
ncbi:hypothetical protein C806_00650 [Lachnospiraceae bacterium 3-1]|mgnify:CR=1 FL=1|nr:hypothetical protein C806_00650 [Lachnospiraceae bacterium 3-1]